MWDFGNDFEVIAAGRAAGLEPNEDYERKMRLYGLSLPWPIALGSVLVANGSIFAIRRELFPELCPEIANDFQIPMEIGARGYGVIYEPEAMAFERSRFLDCPGTTRITTIANFF